MKLYNATSKKLLASDLAIAQTLAEKTIGLIAAYQPKALYFKTRWGIHTFGVLFPLTILICDDTFRIKAIVLELLPNRVYFWNPCWQHIFELPSKNYPVKVGDTLLIK